MSDAAKKRVQEALDHDVCIEKVLDLATAWIVLHQLSHLPDELDDFTDDCWESKHCHPSVEPIMAPVRHRAGDSPRDADVLDGLLNVPEPFTRYVLLLAKTPVRRYANATAWRHSWGTVYTRWVAAPTLDEAWALAVAWADERHAADLAKLEG